MEQTTTSSLHLEEVLRAYAQQRRTGCLSVSFGGQSASIYLESGKISGCFPVDRSPFDSLSEWLIVGEVVSSSFNAGNAKSFDELLILVQQDEIGKVLCEKDVFCRALRHLVLDGLYQLPWESIPSMDFSSHIPEEKPACRVSISVGQLLLDLTALRTDPNLKKITLSMMIERSGDSPSSMNEDEETLYALLEDPMECAELKDRSLLSEYAFLEAVSSLLLQQTIVPCVDIENVPFEDPPPAHVELPKEPISPSIDTPREIRKKQRSEKDTQIKLIGEMIAIGFFLLAAIGPFFLW